MNEWQQRRQRRRTNHQGAYVSGLYGNGMHDFILMETELGFRVAASQDSEDAGWSALWDLSYEQYVREHESH